MSAAEAAIFYHFGWTTIALCSLSIRSEIRLARPSGIIPSGIRTKGPMMMRMRSLQSFKADAVLAIV